MGYPVSRIDDIENIVNADRFNSKFYSIVLYKNEHNTFKNTFRRLFAKYHIISGELIHFFVFDKFHFDYPYGHQHKIDNTVIDLTCKKFEINIEDLPVIILFNNWDSTQYQVIKLKSIENSSNDIEGFFNFVFSPLSNSIEGIGFENTYKLSRVEELLGEESILKDDIFINGRRYEKYFREIEDNNFRKKLINVISEYNQILKSIKIKLEILTKEDAYIANLKRNNRIEHSGKQSDIEWDAGYSKVIEEIHKVSEKMLFELKLLEGFKENKKYNQFVVPEIFEENSKMMIQTSLDLSSFLELFDNKEFDYTPFVSGYWKSIENEMTIIIRDVLMRKKRFIDKIPFKDKLLPNKNEPYTLKWPHYKGKDKFFEVEIVKRNSGKLIPMEMMLGTSKLILQFYKMNEYQDIVKQHLNNINDFNIESFKDKVKVIVELRNKYSHKSRMDKNSFCTIEKIIFEEKIFEDIAKIKAELQKN